MPEKSSGQGSFGAMMVKAAEWSWHRGWPAVDRLFKLASWLLVITTLGVLARRPEAPLEAAVFVHLLRMLWSIALIVCIIDTVLVAQNAASSALLPLATSGPRPREWRTRDTAVLVAILLLGAMLAMAALHTGAMFATTFEHLLLEAGRLVRESR